MLSTVTGVAKVDVTGGAVEEFRVVVDPAKLQAHNLALSDVATALSAANVLTAVGRMEDHDKLYLVVTDTRFKDAGGDRRDRAALRSRRRGPARATWRRCAAEPRRSSPAPPPTGATRCCSTSTSSRAAIPCRSPEAFATRSPPSRRRLPADVKITNWYDQSDLIVASATSVRDAVLIGVALAALVLLLFLRDWKITLIAALAVPVVLGVTALLLYLLDQSFNIMTLGGMAAAVGLIIDDAIVMSEHIVRRLHGAGGRRRRRQRRDACWTPPTSSPGR